jgi:acetyl esterase/lipase
MSERYTGGSPEQYPDRYAVVNSATHISAAAPPTLLIVPEADHLVAPDAAYEFNAQVQAAGVATRLIRMPYAEHAFDLTSGSIGDQLVRQSTLRFLEEHGLKP